MVQGLISDLGLDAQSLGFWCAAIPEFRFVDFQGYIAEHAWDLTTQPLMVPHAVGGSARGKPTDANAPTTMLAPLKKPTCHTRTAHEIEISYVALRVPKRPLLTQ